MSSGKEEGEGEGVHILSILLLLQKLYRTSNCTGLSLKTQELYFLVFATRYIDLLWNFNSLYNSCMKIVFLGSSAWVVYLMRKRLWSCYREYARQDSFSVWKLIVPCAVLSLVWNEINKDEGESPFFALFDSDNWTSFSSVSYASFEVLWAFSIFLEAVALLPQCVLHYNRKGLVDMLTADYVFCLGAYRLLYLFNWMWRWRFDPTYIHSWLVSLSGLVQILLFLDFGYYYILSRMTNKPLVLPI